MDDLVAALRRQADMCRGVTTWGQAADRIELIEAQLAALKANEEALQSYVGWIKGECASRDAKLSALRTRLEIDPRHPYDGIYSRDETIRQLEEQVDTLRATNSELELQALVDEGQARGEYGVPLPHISNDENGFITMEWWVGERKITMYPHDEVLLKVWGSSTINEMSEIPLAKIEMVRDAFRWLAEGKYAAPAVEPVAKKHSTLGQQVTQAQAEVATWPKSKRESVQLQGGTPSPNEPK